MNGVVIHLQEFSLLFHEAALLVFTLSLNFDFKTS